MKYIKYGIQQYVIQKICNTTNMKYNKYEIHQNMKYIKYGIQQIWNTTNMKIH